MNVFKKLSEAQIPAPIHTARGRPCPQPEGGLRRSVDQGKCRLSACGWGCQNENGMRGTAPYSMLRTLEPFLLPVSCMDNFDQNKNC